MLNIAL